VTDRTARKSVGKSPLLSLSRKQWPYGRHTEETDFIPGAIVLHEELVPVHDVIVEIAGRRPNLGLEVGQEVRATYNAIAMSAIFASHVQRGLIVPGLT
jgi:hypothetical protein